MFVKKYRNVYIKTFEICNKHVLYYDSGFVFVVLLNINYKNYTKRNEFLGYFAWRERERES